MRRLWWRWDHLLYVHHYGHAWPSDGRMRCYYTVLRRGVTVDRDRGVLHAAPVSVRRWRARGQR